MIAVPPLDAFYTLDAITGRLDAWNIPMHDKATPTLSLPCLASGNCVSKNEHLFLAP